MDIRDVQAIDVHAHYGEYIRDGFDPLTCELMSGDAATVAQRARDVNVQWTVVSPLLGLLPRGRNDAIVGNEEAARLAPQTPGLLYWVIVDPLRPATYDQAREMLQLPHCMGIKIHPEEHLYPISDHGEELFAFAAEQCAMVLAHSGNENSWPIDFIPFANAHPEMSVILAHLGNSGTDVVARDLQVRAVQASTQGNVYTDTSSSNSILPKLIEFGVRELGADRIFFGTDTPLYYAPMQRARVDFAEISDADKHLILRGNAERLLSLPADK